ncbi:unnamed protein product [Amoebophrya sp. A25]|nr:unnamed protein product [Amoebophrya sp. A25]|eukprot:GSA25T00000411001.1
MMERNRIFKTVMLLCSLLGPPPSNAEQIASNFEKNGIGLDFGKHGCSGVRGAGSHLCGSESQNIWLDRENTVRSLFGSEKCRNYAKGCRMISWRYGF